MYLLTYFLHSLAPSAKMKAPALEQVDSQAFAGGDVGGVHMAGCPRPTHSTPAGLVGPGLGGVDSRPAHTGWFLHGGR